MLRRKVEETLETWKRDSRKALLVTGARQIGKSYSIRAFGMAHYSAFVEFNLLDDKRAKQVFSEASDATDFINRISLLSEQELMAKTRGLTDGKPTFSGS